MHVKWGALGDVFLVGLGVTIVVVVLFSLGVNAMAARADALEGGSATAGKAAPATALAALCFSVCALVVAYGIYLIVT
jgi:hypothetical protein